MSPTVFIFILLVFLILSYRVEAIWQGTKADWRNYPFVAKIYAVKNSTTSLCTGVAIAKRVVLTAAHCVVPAPTNTRVYFSNGSSAAASNIIVHPDYTVGKDP